MSLALVAKSPIATKIMKAWAHVVGKTAEHELISVSTDVDPLLGEVFTPCFWSFGKKTHKVFYSTDYGLTEFKVILEGACLFIGRPVPDEGLKNFGSFCQTVCEYESQNWLDECHDHGWAVLLKKGEMLGIPAGHAYIQVCVEESHGLRILKGDPPWSQSQQRHPASQDPAVAGVAGASYRKAAVLGELGGKAFFLF